MLSITCLSLTCWSTLLRGIRFSVLWISGYNQVFIAKEDVLKMTFRCPGALGTYEWVAMPFGLKSASAIYQRAMNTIFHEFIGKFIEAYIDNVVVKSDKKDTHLDHLRKALEKMRKHGLKMNPLKCAFGLAIGNLLGFIHKRGLQTTKTKPKLLLKHQPYLTKNSCSASLGKSISFDNSSRICLERPDSLLHW